MKVVNVIKLKLEIMWTGGLPTKTRYLTYLGSPTSILKRVLRLLAFFLNILAD